MTVKCKIKKNNNNNKKNNFTLQIATCTEKINLQYNLN